MLTLLSFYMEVFILSSYTLNWDVANDQYKLCTRISRGYGNAKRLICGKFLTYASITMISTGFGDRCC